LDISFPFFVQLAHSIVILHRLSTFEDSIWDRRLVRETVDVLVVLEQLVGNFRSLRPEGVEGDGDLFGKLAMVFEWVRDLSKSKLDGDIERNGGIESMHGEMEVMTDGGMQEMLGIMDDAWLGDMLGSWSYDFMSR
jgi:hypothetical protein